MSDQRNHIFGDGAVSVFTQSAHPSHVHALVCRVKRWRLGIIATIRNVKILNAVESKLFNNDMIKFACPNPVSSNAQIIYHHRA